MKKILCVDDEPMNLMIIEINLMDQGYEVHKASDGASAVKMVYDLKPDLVLLDIKMPGMDGIETLKVIRTMNPDMPVIMVTAVSDEAIAKSALEYGAQAYVSKPIDFEHLNEAILTKML